MNRSFKKIVAVVSAIAMVVTSLTIYNAKTASADTDYSTLTYKVTDNNPDLAVAFVDGNTATEVNYCLDQGVNFYCATTAATVKPDFKTVTCNGITDSAPGAGANFWVPMANLKKDAYNLVTIEDAVGGTYRFCIKYGTPVEGETTTPDPDAPTTTTALQAPSAPIGLVVNINDLKTNYTIAFQPGANSKTFKLYIDGTYKRDINNGIVLTIAELGLESGKTYTFGVSAANEAGESPATTVQVTVPAAEVPTDPGETEPEESFDPSTITDWTEVTGSETILYHVINGTTFGIAPEIFNGKLRFALTMAAPYTVTLDGEDAGPSEGAIVNLPQDMTAGYHKAVITDFYGNQKVTMYFKVLSEAETTTPTPIADGEEILKNVEFNGAANWNQASMTNPVNNGDGTVDFNIDAVADGNPWDKQLVQNGITLTNGRWYVAKYTITSDVDKNFKLLVQSDGAAGGHWGEFAALITNVKAGQTVEVTLKFQATETAKANALMAVLMGLIETPAEAANLKISGISLKGYTNEPDVTTGSVVVGEPEATTHTVTVDGVKVADVEEGDTFVLPAEATYGYFDGTAMYKAETEFTVTSDMAFTSVNDLSVTVEKGAGIRLDGTAGIRFQAKVNASEELLNSGAITEGMLITANDLYEANDSTLDLTSAYTFKNIVNSGWYNGAVGTYCGSIVNIVESNYIRNFIAKAYATVKYTDGTTLTIYSGMTGVRSISGVANAIIDAGALNKFTPDEQAMIQMFAAAK